MKAILTIYIVSINILSISQSHYIGLKGGVSWCNQSGDNIFKNTEQIQRFIFGIDYAFRFKNNLKIGSNVMYSQMGYKNQIIFTDQYGNQINNNSSFSEFHYDYLSIPLKIGYENGNKVLVYGNLGITTSFLLNAKITSPTFNENLEEVGRYNTEITDEVAPIEFGGMIEIGLGYNIIEKFDVFIEGNFHHGFTKITTPDYFYLEKIYNYRASANLGIRYRIK